MALTFNGLQPVVFGGKECTPQINTELKMRLSQINNYNDETDEVLASAFPKEERYVKEFLSKQMTILDKERLHAYLVGGDEMLEQVETKIHELFDKAMTEKEND
jgi:hypothetical protein